MWVREDKRTAGVLSDEAPGKMIGAIRPFNSIGEAERRAVNGLMQDAPILSGFLAGNERGGKKVRELEDAYAKTYNVRNAIACNSATSGLLAAAFAIDLKAGDKFLCPALTMSATAAAPMFTGAAPVFCDVDRNTFNITPKDAVEIVPFGKIKAVFFTSLFGNPAGEKAWTEWAHANNLKIIVDAAQAPLAKEDGVMAGAYADIGVHSLNVHKHIQAGEGGVCLTNDDELARRMRLFVNHSECAGDRIGLNLRMTELTAAIALVQLHRGSTILSGRQELAAQLSESVKGLNGLMAPQISANTQHSFYIWGLKIADKKRNEFVKLVNEAGVPLDAGYCNPLYRMNAFRQFVRRCHTAELLQDEELAMFEICAWDPSERQVKQIGDVFKRAAEKLELT